MRKTKTLITAAGGRSIRCSSRSEATKEMRTATNILVSYSDAKNFNSDANIFSSDAHIFSLDANIFSLDSNIFTSDSNIFCSNKNIFSLDSIIFSSHAELQKTIQIAQAQMLTQKMNTKNAYVTTYSNCRQNGINDQKPIQTCE